MGVYILREGKEGGVENRKETLISKKLFSFFIKVTEFRSQGF